MPYRFWGLLDSCLAAEDAGVTSAEATAKLNIALHSNLDKSARDLVAWLGPKTKDNNGNEQYDAEKVNKIKGCWKSAGVPENTRFIVFMNDDPPDASFATERTKVFDCVSKSP
jgi:hypothetical protein